MPRLGDPQASSVVLSITIGFRMPRVGDPEASCAFRIVSEFGYLSSIILGCWLDTIRHNPTFNYWSGGVMALGRPFMAYNFVWLILDKLNSPYARPYRFY
uniref:Uncharacterized protein n=1 Tax=Avena sativa TaxID=4498 RepID=A0ACD6A4Y9_AVESA